MSRKFLKEFRDGESVDEVFLLADKQLRANRNADLYLLASLRDKTGLVNGLMWNVTEESVSHLSTGDFVRARGKVQLYQGGLQMIVTHIDKVPNNSVDPAEFHPERNKDIEPMLNRVREILTGIDNPPLRSLMECFLIDEPLMQSFCQAPAGVKAHHAYEGGLLEHILNMMEVALRIDDLYPDADTNLVLAGVFLHDLGKVRELGYESSFVYTDEGQLLGHMTIAVEMLTEKIQEAEKLSGEDFPAEVALRLKHIILSHHGTYEFGSPRLPMTPEAVIVHYLDNLDAKVHEFTRAIDDDPNADSHWTPFFPRLNRKLFKGGKD